jgi:hypothetical protein
VFYKEFCSQAYGHDLHHAPERSMNDQQVQVLNGEGMARTFGMACADDHIADPKLGLPTLFTVDAALGLTDGQLWTFDCGTTICSAASPWQCVRHQVLPFAPQRLPQQFDPGQNRWIQDTFNPWLFAPGEHHDSGHDSGAGHSHGGQPDTGHSDNGSSHEGHAHSGSPDGGGHDGASQGGDGGGHHSGSGGSDSGNYGGISDTGGSGGGFDSGSSGGSSDSGSSGGGSSCGGSSCGGSS